MIRVGRWFGIPVRIHPAALPLAALAIWLGEGDRLMVMSGSILFHELMHVTAARLMRVRVMELEIMPMGGAARLENLWRLRPGQMTIVALAGPAGNILLMMCAAALCWWNMLPACWTAVLIEQNAMIFLFNMLPVLPMDGGRVVSGLLSRRIPAARAVRLGIWSGYVLATLLAGLTAYGLMRGRMNITLPTAALYLITSARRERNQAENSWIESLTGRGAEMDEEEVLPVCWLAVRGDTTVREAAVHMKPRHVHRLAVYDERMRLEAVAEETELIEALLTDVGMTMREMKGNVKEFKERRTKRTKLAGVGAAPLQKEAAQCYNKRDA